MLRPQTPRLPAEWEPIRALLLQWPPRPTHAIHKNLLHLAKAAGRHTPLIIGTPANRKSLQRQLRRCGIPARHIHLCTVRSNDLWCRDCAPLGIMCGSRAQLLDFRFDGWGQRYRFRHDAQLGRRLQRQGAFAATRLHRIGLTLEGGGIDSDGQGSLLLNRRWPLARARNPGYDTARLERTLTRHLGCTRFLWIDCPPLPHDHTDGHIDLLARFCAPGTIAYTAPAQPGDPATAALGQLHLQLQNLRQTNGMPYHLVPLPRPTWYRVPASYTNFLLLPSSVLVPQYGDMNADRNALRQLQTLFPDRRAQGIDCQALIREGGALHCAAIGLPAAVMHPQRTYRHT